MIWSPPPADEKLLAAVAAEHYNLTWVPEEGLDRAARHGLRAMLASACSRHNHIGDTIKTPDDGRMTHELRLRVGRAITPEQFELLSDEQLARLLPRAVREFFPGKDFCADGSFYLHDGTAWSFYKGGFVDD